MPTYAALLRAINVGGTGKLAMADLVKLCATAGFINVTTYIQSGNVVFTTKLGEAKAVAVLEAALAKKLGKPVGVLVRTADELEAVLANNPFMGAPTNRVIVMFHPAKLPASSLDGVKGVTVERLALRGREVYIHYPDGQGTSKLKLPGATTCTGRNLNTIAKLVELARR